MNDASFHVPAETNGQKKSPETMDDLLKAIEDAKAEVESEAQTPITIFDIAAAAFVSLETIVALLGKEKGDQVIAQFEARVAAFHEMEVVE